MLICQHCGSESSENSRVCGRCGKSLAPQFSTQYLQPPQSYRSRQYSSDEPAQPMPAYTYYPPVFPGPHTTGWSEHERVRIPSDFLGTPALISGVVSVVSGIVGWMLPIVGAIFGIIAISLGVAAITRKETYGATGLVLGIIGLMLWALWALNLTDIFYGLPK
ncbi:MAG: hypothetical protein ACE5IJ_03045 [Thermoplasmata archaeon]